MAAPKGWQIGFQAPATEMMDGIVNLHHDIMGILGFILGFVTLMLVAGTVLFSVRNLKKVVGTQFRLKDIPRQRFFSGHGNTYHTVLETVWTIVPTLVLLFIATPSFALIYALDEIVEPALTIRITGHQWYWSYEYTNSFQERLDFSYPPFLDGEMSTLFAQTHKMLPSGSIQPDRIAMKMRDFDKGGLLLNTWLDLITDLNHPTLAKTALKELVGIQGYLPEFGLYHPEQIAFNQAFHAYEGSEWVPFMPQNCVSPVDVKDWDFTARGAILAAATLDDTIDWDAMATTPTGRASDQVGPKIQCYFPVDETLDEKLKVMRIFPPLTFDSRMIAEDDLHTYHFRLLDTDEAVALPIGVTIRLLITSDDVLHSWAVPAFGVKVDAVPGRVNEYFLRVKFPGVYFGQCSEICGVNHGFMPISIRALEWDYFTYWWRTESLALYRRGSLDAPFSIEFNYEAFCLLADAVLKDLTCTHGFIGHELHRLTQNALYDGGFEVSKYLVYRQMVASIAIHTCGLKSYPMVFDKPDIEFMVYTVLQAMAQVDETFRFFFSPEYMFKHYRHIYIPRMDMVWDFDSAYGLERVSHYQIVRSYDSFFDIFGDRSPEDLKPASFYNFYPPNSQNYSDWRKDARGVLMPPINPNSDELLPRGKYPTRGTMYVPMHDHMTRYSRNLEGILHNATRLKPDPKCYPLGLAQAQLDHKIALWRQGKAALAGRYSWPEGTQVELLAPLGTEYYLKQGLYKKGDAPTMPAVRFPQAQGSK